MCEFVCVGENKKIREQNNILSDGVDNKQIHMLKDVMVRSKNLSNE